MSYFITDSFVDDLQQRPLETLCTFFAEVEGRISTSGIDWSDDERLVLEEAVAVVAEVVESSLVHGWEGGPLPPIEGSSYSDLYQYVLAFQNWCQQELRAERVDGFRGSLRRRLRSKFAYEFEPSELSRIQVLINELRTEIGKSEVFEDENHRLRLLRRLERLQCELHERVSDIDRFWGLVGEAGVVLGKFGEAARPIVDRIREIAQVVWRVQLRSEELPEHVQPPQLTVNEQVSGDEKSSS